MRKIRIDAPQVGMIGGDGSPVYRSSHQEEGMSKEENLPLDCGLLEYPQIVDAQSKTCTWWVLRAWARILQCTGISHATQ